MDRGSDWWLLLPEPVRRFPADLAATVALTVLTVLVVLLPYVQETPLRVVFGLPFVLFLPGYAFVAALFPEEGESPTAEEEAADGGGPDDQNDGGGWSFPGRGSDDDEPGGSDDSEADSGGIAAIGPSTDRGIDGIERVALSFGLSIAIVPLIGLGLNFTPWGITLVPILVSVSAFTIGCSIVAASRRWDLPEEDRFRVPYGEWIDAGRAELFDPDDRLDAALNVLLAASILLAVGSVGYAIAVPPQGEQFTEFYLLTENDDGERVAANYPEELTVGEPAELVVGVGNNEHEEVEYTVVVQLQEVEIEGNETRVLERDRIDRFDTTLAHNETWQHTHDVVATRTGEDLRLQYLLFRGDPPEEPTEAEAYRDLHLWVDVEEPQQEG